MRKETWLFTVFTLAMVFTCNAFSQVEEASWTFFRPLGGEYKITSAGFDSLTLECVRSNDSVKDAYAIAAFNLNSRIHS